MNFVLVIFINSSRRLQNLVTFASSSGASTSSNTQIGEGLVKKTAKIKERAVKLVHLLIIKLLIEVFYLED